MVIMGKLIKLQCPVCKYINTIEYKPGDEKGEVICINCKNKKPLRAYKLVTPDQKASSSAPKPQTAPAFNGGSETELTAPNYSIGRLRLKNSGISFQLKDGKNVIGRKSGSGKADFQIDTGAERGMSREHVVINVLKERYKGYVHYMSLCKENVNPTTLNGQQLFFGVDRMILHDGDILGLPNAELVFEIPDEDETRLI